jgi:hypothetical protein
MGQELAALGNAEAPDRGFIRQRDANKIGAVPLKVKPAIAR